MNKFKPRSKRVNSKQYMSQTEKQILKNLLNMFKLRKENYYFKDN